MIDFSISNWLRRFFWRQPSSSRRLPHDARLSRVEALEDRSLLTLNLPIAIADVYNVNEDTTLNGSTVLANDTDADGDTVNRAVLNIGTLHGSLSLNNDGTFVYIPNANYNGIDTFTYFARDSVHNETGLVFATVTINVTAVNDAPIATPKSISTVEDQPVTGTLTGTDVDGNPLQFSAGVLSAAHGTVTIGPNGSFTYTPEPDFNGADAFSFKANDGTTNSVEASVSVTITPANDAPTATATSITVNEDGTFSGFLNASDVDGDSVTFAAGAVTASHGTISINSDGSFVYTPTPNYNGSDSFSFKVNDGIFNSVDANVAVTVNAVNDVPQANAANITVNEDGVFSGTLTGNDIDGDPLTFLAGTIAAGHGSVVINSNGSYTYTPAANYNGPDSFTIRANDGTVNSSNATVTVTVTSVSDQPVATAASITVNEDGVFSGTLAGLDADGDPLTFAAGAVTASHGSVVVNSNGSFTYTPDANYNGADSFSFKVNDGALNSVDATVSVTVTAVNDAPSASATSITTNEDNAFSGTLAGTDVDGNPLTFLAGTVAAGHGAVVINSNGTFTYTPEANYFGSDSFTFRVNDGTVNSPNATVSISVTSVNDIPAGVGANITTNEDGVFTGTLTGTDVDGNPLTFLAGTIGAAHGTVVINSNGSFTYTPDANYNGPDSFTFRANDGTVNSPNATVSVSVTPVADVPVATAASFSVLEDAVFAGTLAGVDVDGDSLTFSAGTVAAAHGTVVINSNGSFTYTPDANYNGTDSFSFKVNDGSANSLNATMSVTVTAVNDIPAATATGFTVLEDAVFSGSLAGTDIDGNPLTFSAGTVAAAHGTVVINSNGSFTYTPAANYNGTDTFNFKVNDGTVNSPLATVSVTVTAVSDPPTATASSITVTEDTRFDGTLSGVDADGNPLTFAAGAVSPAHGTVVINANGSFSYTPHANYTGSDTFSFKVNDGSFNSTDANVSVTVTAVNDAPVATATSISATEDTTFSGNLAAVDVDGNPLTFAAGTIAASRGTVVLNSNGSFTYTPAPNYSGADSFTFRVNDGILNSAEATVTILVAAVNDAPAGTGASITLSEDGTYTGTLAGTDADGNSLTFSAGTVAAGHGTAIINSNGSFTYTPNANYTGTDAFTFKVNDGTVNSPNATVSVTITAVNDAPIATAASITTLEDTAFNGSVSATDADGNPITYLAGAIATAHGSVVINSNGTFLYTPAANYSGTDSFSFKATDGTLTSAEATVTITVTAANDGPTANPAVVTVSEDGTLGGTLTGADTEGNTLTFSAGAITAGHGAVVINANGSYIYTPHANYNGSDTFSFRVNDGSVNSPDANVSITVTAVNDAPVASGTMITVNEDGTFNGVLSGSDVDGDPLTFSAGAIAAAHGTVTINANGTFSYVPAANYNGTDSFGFRVHDGRVNSADATMQVVITSVNDAPSVNRTALTTNEDTSFNGALTGSDPEGSILTFRAGAVAPANGTLVVNPNGFFTYTPRANFSGQDLFSVVASDGTSDSAAVLVSVTIVAVNDAPAATPSNYTIAEDTPLVGTLAATDPEGNPVTFAAGAQAAAHGTVVINSNGTFTYTPASNYNGVDVFSFVANDGTATGPAATITVNITGTQDPPVASSGTPRTITTNEDQTFTGTLTGTDPDGDPLSFLAGSVAAAHGTVTINSNGSFTYVPQANYFGNDSFSYRVNDGLATSIDATVNVTVISVNDAPVANAFSVTAGEDQVLTGMLTGFDIDGDSLTFASGLVSPNRGTLVINPNGSYTYTPNANFSGTDSFGFKVNDGKTSSSDATVSISVTAVNDAPAVVDGAGLLVQDAPFIGSLAELASDADGEARTFVALTQPAHGNLVVNANGTFTYTPDSGFNGTDSFTFRANDGQANSNVAVFTLTVTDLFELQLSQTPGRIATKRRSAVPQDPNARLVGVSPSVHFGNASITAAIVAGGDRRDRVLVTRGAAQSGAITVRGKRIFFNGSEVARTFGGRRAQPLQISFNSGGTLAAINTVLQRISVRTTRTASRAVRTLQIQVHADGATSTDRIDGQVV